MTVRDDSYAERLARDIVDQREDDAVYEMAGHAICFGMTADERIEVPIYAAAALIEEARLLGIDPVEHAAARMMSIDEIFDDNDDYAMDQAAVDAALRMQHAAAWVYLGRVA